MREERRKRKGERGEMKDERGKFTVRKLHSLIVAGKTECFGVIKDLI
jgi:hypothetical protein